ncbi:predicted protein [Aspergillus nidulans FGSC A4]|uniref:Uncharacterized protein n=1 Tax=Emericella nidulans (strain FGSC A4 / ATCC 38163 / CBS 112.46 / NRRL 194 / M139) TaxID=227321 RepID=Q5AW70_EMENI|nr:hypothetical protein [Aspergillus nidulans FGSC A4]EAA62040.1 predicted protein [Aspergillus nidulans FGSC A4]CBF79425.1 TPA: conserved hypothetical protein [Aspergillus nidulans FGSC A4]|eukprot:XP_680729.1 predicted protein [Aspergillus nidulans FGSC A4]
MNFVYLFLLAFSAIVSAEISIEASILNRLLQLDIGLYGTFILLDRFDDGANVTLSDIVVFYNTVTAPGQSSIQPFSSPCDEAIQFSICQAYHSFALTSIKLYNEFADGADDFDKGLRNNLREGFNRIYIENSGFVDNIAPVGLPLCFESIQQDCWALNKVFLQAWNALDPAAKQ